MAKALIGYLNSDLRTPARLVAENSRLRARVGELEELVLRLSEDNDRLTAARAVAMLDLESAAMQEMQPA
ncbi:MAG: hypothetical protein JWN22_3114 [Nocardioides sp.]|jgi:hypothetical protein|nr:hypothetical protein [Nocardioides sp.]